MLSRSYSILMLNQDWLVEELRGLGHKVITASFDGRLEVKYPNLCQVNDILKLLPADFKPDCIIYFDNSYPLTVLGFEECAIPSVFVSVDTHHHYSWHRFLPQLFNLVLVAQRDYLQYFGDTSSDSAKLHFSWFPLWANQVDEPSEEKDIEVCFRGTLDPVLHPKRCHFFSELGRLVGGDFGSGNYREAYRRAKIVVNQTVSGDLNFRVFEAMICGALLLTPSIGNGLSELFAPGEDLLCYPEGDVDEAARLIKYYLQNERERIAIAAKGREKVLESHTARCRAIELVNWLDKIEDQQRVISYRSAGIVCLNSAISAERPKDLDKQCHGAKRYLANETLRLFKKAVAANEDICQESEVYLIMLKKILGSTDQESFQELVQELMDRNPDNVLLALWRIQQLIILGEKDKAAEVSLRLCGEPDKAAELREHVTELVARLEDCG